MQLQIALDSTLETALEILELVAPYVDIAEIGTPLVFREGMHGVRRIRQSFPELSLLVDLKIMDAGEEEATIAFEAGADLVTVMGVTADATIQGAVHSARRHQGQVMVDMMGVQDLVGRSRHLCDLGCDMICLHTAYDVQSTVEAPYRDLELLKRADFDSRLAIAGGIKLDTLAAVLTHRPDIVIVGGGICRAANPRKAAQEIKAMMSSLEP